MLAGSGQAGVWQEESFEGGAAATICKALIELARRDGIIAEIGTQLQQHQTLLQANESAKLLENPSADIRSKPALWRPF